ncbi:MAG: type II methionyl aminopeptidase [Candidatus Micrarchaeia archaeon]
MKEDELKNYKKAAEIAAAVLGTVQIKPGMKVLDIAEGIENKIKELGGKPAFPANISCNEYAAHDTASLNDARTLGEKDIVKIDIGVHVEGYIADRAVTFDFSNEHGKLLEASQRALEDAVATVKAGINVEVIGGVIENAIKIYGFRPIENLTGHSLGKYTLHAGVEIPNFAARGRGALLEEGDVIAIEPFATDGAGIVVETTRTEIFSALFEMPVRNAAARQMFKSIKEIYHELPFAERWVADTFEKKLALRDLVRNGSVRSYPVLREKSSGMVAQFEHTIIVNKDSAEVLI